MIAILLAIFGTSFLAPSLFALILSADEPTSTSTIVSFTVLGLAAWGAALLVFRRISINDSAASCRVDAECFSEGPAGSHIELRWDDVATQPWQDSDITIYQDYGYRRRHFFRIPVSDQRTVEIPLQLRWYSTDRYWYRANEQRAAVRALLLRLAIATNPPARFDAEVFAKVGLNPDTWERSMTVEMARAIWGTVTAIAIIPALWFLSSFAHLPVLDFIDSSPVRSGVIFTAYLLVSVIFMDGWTRHRYPKLSGVFSFEAPADQENPGNVPSTTTMDRIARQ